MSGVVEADKLFGRIYGIGPCGWLKIVAPILLTYSTQKEIAMADTPPLMVNGFVKSKLVPFRFEKESSATPQAFKARARFFDLLEESRLKKLDQPSLVSSLHGEIDRVLFTIPYWVFFAESFPGEEALIQKYANAFRHILATLPNACRVVLFTNEVSADKARSWLSEFGLSARSELVTAPDGMKFTVWAEDAYCICKDVADGETYFVEPASFTRAEDAYIADRVAPKTDLESTQVQLYFQGGNVLIGDDFWFIGADYPAHSLELGFVVPQPGETTSAAITRVYGSFMDRDRKLIVVGSRVPVPSNQKRPIMVNGELWHEVLYFGNAPGTVQPLFHIDMFVSLAGRDVNGTYTVMVGSPEMAASILGEPLPEGAMQDVFDDVAAGLSALGFKVIRNPLPMAYDDDDTDNTRYWYFATGNNVLTQDGPKKVWIPTYGHGNWTKLAATDAENKRIWESLGYTVELLPDFHPFAANLGAAHCIKKYLGRAAGMA